MICPIQDDQVPTRKDVILTVREAILEHAGAKAALRALWRHGVDRNEFLTLLAATVVDLLRPEVPPKQPDWEIPGMPPRRLLKLAERLEEIAGELENCDRHPFFKQTYGMVPRSYENDFEGLPPLLRKRAFIMKVQITASKRLNSRIVREIEKTARLNLIDYVRQSTEKSRPMYSEVALLLTAALYAVGHDSEVTPESLRTLWHAEHGARKR
jgi:hypothetical protein